MGGGFSTPAVTDDKGRKYVSFPWVWHGFCTYISETLKAIIEMKTVYILSCINESSEIVSMESFRTHKEAQEAMLQFYQTELFSALEEYGADNLVENYTQNDSAVLVVDKRTYALYWCINEVAIDF